MAIIGLGRRVFNIIAVHTYSLILSLSLLAAEVFLEAPRQPSALHR